MSDQPEIKVTVQPSSVERQDLEQRLSDAGLPADGVPAPADSLPDSAASAKPSDVQSGVGVLKGFTAHANQTEDGANDLIERDRQNQQDAQADVLPE